MLEYPASADTLRDDARPVSKPLEAALRKEDAAGQYDVIIRPIITEKSDASASERNAVVFEVAMERHQAADQGSGRDDLQRQGEGGQPHHPQGQESGSRASSARGDVKKAYVTLAEGNTIDVAPARSTGVRRVSDGNPVEHARATEDSKTWR